MNGFESDTVSTYDNGCRYGMDNQSKRERKSYAMQRMVEAIDRAIEASTDAEKQRAARWASAWSAVAGVRSPADKVPGIRLRRSELLGDRRLQPRG